MGFSLLSSYEVEGQIVSINDDARARIQSKANDLGSQGFSLLAVVYAEYDHEQLILFETSRTWFSQVFLVF